MSEDYDEEESAPFARTFQCAVCKAVFVGMMDSLPLCDEHKDKLPKPDKTFESRIACKKCRFVIIELISNVSMGIQVNVQFCQNCGNNDPEEMSIENLVDGDWQKK